MKSFAVTLICVSFVCVSVRGSEVDLRGKWKEDQNLREGLSDFLYEMGKIRNLNIWQVAVLASVVITFIF